MFKKLGRILTATIFLAGSLTATGITAAQATASNDTSLNVTSSKIKGVAISSATATTCLDGPTCATFGTNQVAVNLTSAQATNVSNSGSFITTFVPTDAGATVSKIVKPTYGTGGLYNVTMFNNATAFDPTSTLGTQDNLLVKVTAADGVTVAYYGFKFSIQIDNTLSASSTIKGVTITSLGTPNTSTASIVAGSVTLTSAQAADTSNSGSFVTSFIKDSLASITVRKAPVGTAWASIGVGNAYDGSAAISDGDIFMIFIGSGGPSNRYIINVTVTGGGSSSSSPTLTAEQITAAAKAAADAIAAAKAEAIAAEIAVAQTKLSSVLKSDKPGSIEEYKSSNIQVSTAASLARINAEVLKLSASDRSDFAKIKAIADKIEFDEAFFNTSARPTLDTFVQKGIQGVTERTLATINSKILALPLEKRSDLNAIQEIVKVESFVDRVANPATRASVSSSTLVSKGLLAADSPYKYLVTSGLASYPEGSLNTLAKIEAAIKTELDKAGARKAKTEALKAKIASRYK